jgi:hypothetical protein
MNTDFDLNRVMTHFLPGLLSFDAGLWRYYDNSIFFNSGVSSYSQKTTEDFESFIKRIITSEEEYPILRIKFQHR